MESQLTYKASYKIGSKNWFGLEMLQALRGGRLQSWDGQGVPGHGRQNFTLELKKVEKITRPYRFDPNQIPYNYTVEVTNRFKGFDLIDRVPEELWTEVCDIVQEAVIKTIPK